MNKQTKSSPPDSGGVAAGRGGKLRRVMVAVALLAFIFACTRTDSKPSGPPEKVTIACSATVDAVLDGADLSPELRELLTLRQQASKSSTAKYSALKRWVSSDGRMRGTQQFAGAARTRRWSHRGFQPGNLLRPTISAEEIEIGIAALKAGCADLIYD